ELSLLILDLDLRNRAFAHALDALDLVVDGDRVPEVDRLQEAHAVIADRNHRPVEVLENLRRRRRRVAEYQRPIGKSMPETCLARVLLVAGARTAPGTSPYRPS